MGRRLLAAVLLLAAAPARPESQVDIAVRALRQDSSLKVRAQAAIVLGQRGGSAAVPALRDALAGDEAPAVRIAALAALAKIGDAAGRGAVEAARDRDPDGRVREAAARALAEWPAAVEGVLAFVIEEPAGDAGGAPARQALRDAIARHLRERGFAVVDSGGGYRIKPSVLRLDVETADGKTVIAVRASLIAVDRGGRMTAMLEGGAKLRASGAVAQAALDRYSAQALDAAARTLCDDLAAKLR
ncbi:MAG TPA: HEAT repeat domain-containing protein [Anaeromyxobacteraceae bacterium]|nr:HEAT repeat domain-containing protein [Anaeromyxobacteraceae bacterium]